MESNPLLIPGELPPLQDIEPRHVLAAVGAIVEHNEASIEQLLDEVDSPTWESVVQPVEDLNERLNMAWAPVSHLNGVSNSDALRKAYDAALPVLTSYHTKQGHNTRLYEMFSRVAQQPSRSAWSAARNQALEHALRDFRLAGVALPGEQKERFAQLQEELARLGTAFANNVLDATQGWHRHIATEEELEGIPENVRKSLRQAAVARGLEGHVITLDLPSYLPVMQYGRLRSLRSELYRAYATRASGEGPQAGQWDNTATMDRILSARHEMAALLGFASYADYSLASKMAESPRQVDAFLRDLAQRCKPMAQRELEELRAFARERDDLDDLQAWDVPYYSEQLRQERYALSQQALRPYFPLDRVLSGLFELVRRLFGIEVERVEGFASYHPDVALYHVRRDGEHIASFLLDPFAREAKRGGAWMANCRSRRIDGAGRLHLPVAFLVCNFTPPHGGEPSLLTHDEVTTLFHEFGHGLHHMLTRVEVGSVSGINGVPWDAVELPSQFLENWCWEEEVLALVSRHYETGEALPAPLLQRLLRAKHFQAGLLMLRQLEFALFDMEIHAGSPARPGFSIQGALDAVRAELSVLPVPAFNRFANSFTHVFAGGYAAGYYSYKWAERLSADAYSRFEQEGIFNAATGRSFRESILETGGVSDAAAAFESFMGRAPDSAALLRHSGIEDGPP